MPHEIYEDDGLVLHGQRAWHGLGVVVQEAPSPIEALRLARLDWKVIEEPVWFGSEDENAELAEGWKALVRSDTRRVLAIVKKNYKPVQNAELAEFCYRISQDLRVETAGSLRDGTIVWFLLKGDSFEVTSGDEVVPYLLVTNHHGDGYAVSARPTSIRVVCANTMHLAVNQHACYVRICHIGDVDHQLRLAEDVLRAAMVGRKHLMEQAEMLLKRRVTRRSLRSKIEEALVFLRGEPDTERRKKSMQEAYNRIEGKFEEERVRVGANAWALFNSLTWFHQHGGRRGTDHKRLMDTYTQRRLFQICMN